MQCCSFLILVTRVVLLLLHEGTVVVGAIGFPFAPLLEFAPVIVLVLLLCVVRDRDVCENLAVTSGHGQDSWFAAIGQTRTVKLRSAMPW